MKKVFYKHVNQVENKKMKKDDNIALRVAKTIAITAGICSSDNDDRFDSRTFSDGFTGKLKKKISEYVDSIHAGDAMSNDIRVPYVFFPENYSGEFTDGNYIGKFSIAHINNCEDNNEIQFCINASLVDAGKTEPQAIWSDKYSYSMHVKSFSGERVVLSKSSNAFTVSNIGDYSIMTLLKGEAIIDEYGVDVPAKEAKAGDVANENHEFLFNEFGIVAEDIKKKIAVWIDDNKIVSVISSDVNDEIGQNERNRKGIQE